MYLMLLCIIVVPIYIYILVRRKTRVVYIRALNPLSDLNVYISTADTKI